MKEFDNFLIEHKGKGLVWGDTKIHFSRRTSDGKRKVSSMNIPPEWRNAGGPKIPDSRRPWLPGVSKPVYRYRSTAGMSETQENFRRHESGAMMKISRQPGAPAGQENKTILVRGDLDGAIKYANWCDRKIKAHLLFILPRDLARALRHAPAPGHNDPFFEIPENYGIESASGWEALKRVAVLMGEPFSAILSAWISTRKEMTKDKRKARKAKQKAKKG